jgi:hypothetical protein
MIPTPTLASNSAPPRWIMRGNARTEIVLPRQMKKTAISGIEPVNSAPVNEPKTCAVFGANVLMSDPHASGTTIIPPGIFSIVRLILMAGSRPWGCEFF